MFIAISVALLLWIIIFIGCIVYAVLSKKSHLNVWFLLTLLVGMLLCVVTYVAMLDVAKWALS